MRTDETHDPALRSWVTSANVPGHDFPIQNLPYGVFRRRGSIEEFRCGVAIGDSILDISQLSLCALLPDSARTAATACEEPELNALMALGEHHWRALRLALSRCLRSGNPDAPLFEVALLPSSECEMALPATIGDFTDFFSSIHHASRAGQLVRPDNPLLPNYRWIPIAYHGRSSSIGIGNTVRRPNGQCKNPENSVPVFRATQKLDYEAELGVFVGPGNPLGTSIPVTDADRHIFGLCVLNDWSARDFQAWEAQPLGPFLAKNFATTISPWVVTLDALAPYRTGRPEGAAASTLPYLFESLDERQGGLDIIVEVSLLSAAMRSNRQPAQLLSTTSFRHNFWTVAQMIAHHSSNGCNLRPGDLVGTGTISGPDAREAGCLLELTMGGTKPISLPDNESRAFLADGDRVTISAYCESRHAIRIGFGSCSSEIVAS